MIALYSGSHFLLTNAEPEEVIMRDRKPLLIDPTTLTETITINIQSVLLVNGSLLRRNRKSLRQTRSQVLIRRSIFWKYIVGIYFLGYNIGILGCKICFSKIWYGVSTGRAQLVIFKPDPIFEIGLNIGQWRLKMCNRSSQYLVNRKIWKNYNYIRNLGLKIPPIPISAQKESIIAHYE